MKKISIQLVLLAFVANCSAISSPSDLYGTWTPEETSCKKEETPVSLKSGSWTFENKESDYGQAKLALPDDSEWNSSFTAKYDKDLDQMELILANPDGANANKMTIYKLSKSSMQIGFYLADGTFCKVTFKK